ncbi:MAG TPA: site-2 protease family protein [Burkholderiales bacterium]|nr:site-2 protease family protein [Pseudomonadota bacterium]HVC49454.1 site-2 protease family protein [Burkholderiales bacterium]
MNPELIQTIAISALPLIFAITLHEAAHGYVASRLGDKTAWMLGRVTLNPIAHIDLVGTILMPLVTMLFGGIIFGWAKPVPINFNNLRNPKRDMLWVAIAGPGSNLIQCLLWAVIAKFALIIPGNAFTTPMYLMGRAGIEINSVFMMLNILPILPLDGGRVLTSLLPGPLSYKYSRSEPYGLIILVLLLFTGVLGHILFPMVDASVNLIFSLFNLQ